MGGLSTIQLLIIAGIVLVLVGGATVLIFMKNKSSGNVSAEESEGATDAVKSDVDHIFNTEFREELRNRGRLYFEKIIKENAMFLQQDLRLTTSQLNDYMKQEIQSVLREEFAKYEESIKGAKDLAVSSMEKTQATIDEQRKILTDQLQREITQEKSAALERFDDNMAEIISHHVLTAIGDEMDVSEQLDYIVSSINEHKQAIVEDLKHGA